MGRWECGEPLTGSAEEGQLGRNLGGEVIVM